MISPQLDNTPLIVILLICFTLLSLTVALAYWRGQRSTRATNAESLMEMIPNSLLGLLALLLGFTFSMSLSRFDARKRALVEEANAIESVWLRAGLLPADDTKSARDTLMGYLDHRIDLPNSSTPLLEQQAYLKKTEALQAQLWTVVKAESRRNQSSTTMLFTSSVNDLIDLATLRWFSQHDQVPPVTYVVILVITIACLYSLAFIYGWRKQSPIPLFVLVLLLSMVIGLIQDLDRPSTGVVHVSPQLLLELRDSLASRDRAE